MPPRLDVVALAARSYGISTRLASGVRPITSPPASTATVAPAMLERANLLYLCVHGRQGDPFLYGDREVPLLDLDRVCTLDLAGALVYLAGCWGVGAASDAFLAAGAAAVVADANEAWAGRFLPLGSQALGRMWVRYVAAGMTAGAALDLAVKVYAHRHRSARDREMLATVGLLGDRAAVLRRVREARRG